MTNLEWAMARNVRFRIALNKGQLVLACTSGVIGAALPIEAGKDFLQTIDYLCLCLKTGVEHDESREV